MAMRDMFDNAGCGPGNSNALSNFFNGQLSSNSKLAEVNRWGMGDMHHAPELGPELEFEDQMRFFDNQQEHMNPVEREAHVREVFTTFIGTCSTGAPMPLLEASGLHFTEMEKEKIKNRTRILVGHLAKEAPPDYVENQLASLFNSLTGIGQVQNQRDIEDENSFLESAWGEAKESTRMHMQRGNEWASEYRTFRPPMYYEQDFRELEAAFTRANPGLDWVEEYERFEMPKYSEEEFKELEEAYQEAQIPKEEITEEMQERLEEEQWFSQFLPNGGSTGNQQAEDWVNEFRQFEGGHTTTGQEWVDEFVSSDYGRTTEEDIREIAGRFNQIQDPKMRNSNFMQFVRKIENGDIKFVDNHAVSTNSPGGPPEEWINEFHST